MSRHPEVVFPPESVYAFQHGFDALAEALACTLGPHQGVVFHANEFKARPEVLTDAATIARRITELGEPEENMGAMLLRNLVWRVKERVGDGGATAAVLARAILQRTQKLAGAGINRMALVRGVSLGARAAAQQLRLMSQPVQGEEDLNAVARAVSGNEELSWMLAEMFHILGPHAHITVEEYISPVFERVYIDGGRWAAQLISPHLINATAAGMAVQANVQVALYDGNLTQDEQVRPLLLLAAQADPPAPLLLVAHKISGEALNLLTATHQQTVQKVAAVNLTRAGAKALLDLQDLETLTGARLISPALGQKLENITRGHLGRAQRVEAGREDLFVAGGLGDRSAARGQIEMLHSRLQALPPGDEARSELEMRLGRLSGSAGVLKVGSVSPTERQDLLQRAEQAVKTLRISLEEGLLPGGGSAYVQCMDCVEAAASRLKGEDEEAALGALAVAGALSAPFRRILANAGVNNPGVYEDEVRRRPNCFFDVQTRSLRDAHHAGVLDAAMVLGAALESAASGAMMALSTDTLIVKRNPIVSREP